jgi:hypothetical protein
MRDAQELDRRAGLCGEALGEGGEIGGAGAQNDAEQRGPQEGEITGRKNPIVSINRSRAITSQKNRFLSPTAGLGLIVRSENGHDRAVSSASRFFHWNLGQPIRNGIRGISWKAEFEQGNRRNLKAGRTGTAVDQHRNAGGLSTGLSDNIETFGHPPTTGDDILYDEDRLFGFEGEAAPQHQRVVLFFSENITHLCLPCDFLTNHETTHRWCQNGGEANPVRANLGQEEARKSLYRIHPLADLSALKIMRAVQSRAEHEMTLQQGTSTGENLQSFLLNCVHGETLGKPSQKTKSIFPNEQKLIRGPFR